MKVERGDGGEMSKGQSRTRNKYKRKRNTRHQNTRITEGTGPPRCQELQTDEPGEQSEEGRQKGQAATLPEVCGVNPWQSGSESVGLLPQSFTGRWELDVLFG